MTTPPPESPPARDHAVIAWIHNGTVAAAFAASMIDLIVAGATPVDGAIVFASGPNICTARNRVVNQFLAGETAPWLLMADTDMVFTRDALDRLIDAAHPADRPIVGGLCYQRNDAGDVVPTLFQIDEDARPARFRRMEHWPDGELVQVAATGAAFLLCHRDALAKIAAEAACPGAPWFRETPTGTPLQILGEDTTFFLTAGMAGVPCYVHTGIKVGHVKQTMLGTVG